MTVAPLGGCVNVRALGTNRLVVVGLVAVAMVGMALFGGLWRPLAVGLGAGVGLIAAIVAERIPDAAAAIDDVPPPLFALVGVAFAWGGAAYAPALALSSFAGIAVGYVLATAAFVLADA
jgi:hypothetical protein